MAAGLAWTPLRAAAAALPKDAPEHHPDAFLAIEDSCKRGAFDLIEFAGKPGAESAPTANLLTSEARGQLALYAACRASLPDAMQKRTCDVVKGFPAVAGDCREAVGFAGVVWAALNKGDVRSACAQYSIHREANDARSGNRGKKSGSRRCGVLAEAARNGRPICEQLVAAKLVPSSDAAECRKVLAYWSGKPADCAVIDEGDRETCRLKAGFIAAARPGTVAACMGSPLCGALMTHTPQSCEPYLQNATKLVCEQAAHAGDGLRKGRRVQEEKKNSDKTQYKKGQPMGTLNPELQKTLKKMRDKSAPEPTENKDKEPENPQGQSQEQE